MPLAGFEPASDPGTAWIFWLLGLFGIILVIQSTLAYIGVLKSWIDVRWSVRGWPLLAMLFGGQWGIIIFGLLPFSSYIVTHDGTFTAWRILIALSWIGVIFWPVASLYWMPRFMLPGWIRRPLKAGLEVDDYRELLEWERRVGAGEDPTAAAQAIKDARLFNGEKFTYKMHSTADHKKILELVATGMHPFTAVDHFESGRVEVEHGKNRKLSTPPRMLRGDREKATGE